MNTSQPIIDLYQGFILTTSLPPPYHHIPLSYVEHHKSIRTKINCNFGSEKSNFCSSIFGLIGNAEYQ